MTNFTKQQCAFIASLVFFCSVVVGCVVFFLQESKISSLEEKIVVMQQGNIDLSYCGDFPIATDGHGGVDRYYVCRDTAGSCYYKEVRQEEIDGCEYDKDKYPYGKDECLKAVVNTYDAEGNQIKQNIDASTMPTEGCAATTQTYFDSKIRE